MSDRPPIDPPPIDPAEDRRNRPDRRRAEGSVPPDGVERRQWQGPPPSPRQRGSRTLS